MVLSRLPYAQFFDCLGARIFGKCALAILGYPWLADLMFARKLNLENSHCLCRVFFRQSYHSKVNLDFSEYLEAELEDIHDKMAMSMTWEHDWPTCWVVATASGTIFVECGH